SKARTTATASGSKSRARADFARWGAGKQAAYARWAADRAAGVNTDTATLAEVGGVVASRVRHWRSEFTARYRTEPPAAPDQPSEHHTATTTVPMAKHNDSGPRESAA
ncbi:MAG: hypothetical protein ACJ73S_13100, partial [Mycobacteriales bacterium]